MLLSRSPQSDPRWGDAVSRGGGAQDPEGGPTLSRGEVSGTWDWTGEASLAEGPLEPRGQARGGGHLWSREATRETFDLPDPSRALRHQSWNRKVLSSDLEGQASASGL